MWPFKKKQDKKKVAGLSGNIVHVVIKKKIGESLITTITEFDAVQQQDENYTFKLVEENLNFKEDYSFEKNTAIALIEAKLSNLDSNKALAEIEKNIKEHVERLKLIHGGFLFKDEKSRDDFIKAKTKEEVDVIDKEKVNLLDERNDLKLYESMKFYYENKGDYCSYEELTKDGKRQVTFLAREGILTPFSINVAESNMYSDISTKKKIYYEKDYDIEKRFLESQRSGIGQVIFMVGWIVVGVLILGGIFFLIRAHEKYERASAFLEESWVKDMVDKSRLTTVSCGYYYSELLRLGYLNKTFIEPTLAEQNKGTGNPFVDFTGEILN